MPTALIAEDEPLLAESLRAELRRQWPELAIVAMAADGLSAAREALQHRPDICFLDIRMPGATGLEAAQVLAEDWPLGEDEPPFPLLVFVTAYDQYALQAFEAQAADYLVKPVQAQRLTACLTRLRQRLAERASPPSDAGAADPASPNAAAQAPPLDDTLAQLRALLASAAGARHASGVATAGSASRLEVIQASVGQTVHMVPVAEVLYFEAADKYVRVITADADHLIRTSLRELLPQLDPQQFWQVHRSLVVRASAITTAVREETGKITLSLRGRSEKLTASRLYAHLFKGM